MTQYTSAGIPYPDPTDTLQLTYKAINDMSAAMSVQLAKPSTTAILSQGTSNGSGDISVPFPALATLTGAMLYLQGTVVANITGQAGNTMNAKLYRLDTGAPAANTAYIVRAIGWGVPA